MITNRRSQLTISLLLFSTNYRDKYLKGNVSNFLIILDKNTKIGYRDIISWLTEGFNVRHDIQTCTVVGILVVDF